MEKEFFKIGDIVMVDNLDEHIPEMIVRGRKFDDDRNFIGIECIWFDKNYVLHEGVFNTKELKTIRPRIEKGNDYNE